MSMPRAAVSFLTSCSDSSKGWRGQRPTLNWRAEERAKGYGSMSRLACAACGAEDQIATVVLPAGTNAATEALAGLVERVTFHNEENGFCVLRVKARGQRDLITVLGHAAMISAGEFVQASGAWVNDRTHGVQFRASFLKAMPPTTTEGIEKYLGSGMIRHWPGLRQETGARLRPSRVRHHRAGAAAPARGDRDRPETGGADHRRLGRAEGDPRDHAVPAQQQRRHVSGGAYLQDLWCGCRPTDLGEPVTFSPRHSRYRLPHRRPDRDQARHRENRAHSRPCRHLLRARRGDGRRTLRPANGRAHSPRAEAARGVAGAGRDGYRPRTSGRHRHCR